ncbi:MAG: hypothetical protein AAGA67_05515 [Cyanobacteria bacterium P01_F01_bin.153]
MRSAKAADPLCYFSRPDGTTENLTYLCGASSGETLSRPRPSTTEATTTTATNFDFDDYLYIRVGTTLRDDLENRIGPGTELKSINRQQQSTERPIQWIAPNGDRMGVLVINRRITFRAYRSNSNIITTSEPRLCALPWQLNRFGNPCGETSLVSGGNGSFDGDTPATVTDCHPSYPTVCIPPPPARINCSDVAAVDFVVEGEDPHRLDQNNNGVGCESR